MQMAPDYDHLTLMQKVEVFEHAVNNTAGDDLAKLLWLKSPSSEVRPLSLVHALLWAPPSWQGGFLVCSGAPVDSSLPWLAADYAQLSATKIKWLSRAG